jgi:predicted RNA-binding protein YlqC (UPF0109 family)
VKVEAATDGNTSKVGSQGRDKQTCSFGKPKHKMGSEGLMKEIIEQIAKALVDNPEQVSLRPIEGEQATVFELRVAQSDLGEVIGKQGRTATSIRTILSAAGMKLRKRFTLEILE